MAHKSKFVSTVGGYAVTNNGIETAVINQDGTLAGGAVIDDNSVTNAKLALPNVKMISQTVAFSEFTDGSGASGTLALTATLPVGAVVTQTLIDDVTGFTGDTSAVVTIGDGSVVDRYNTGTPNVFVTAGAISAGAVSGTAFHSAVKTVTLTVTSAADFTSVVAGAMTVTIFYYQA